MARKAVTLLAEGAAAWERGDVRAARAAFERAAILAAGVRSLVLTHTQALCNGANAAYVMGDNDAALTGFRAALSMCDAQPGDTLLMMRPVTHMGIGSVLLRTGDYPGAQDAFELARHILETSDQPAYGGHSLAELHVSALTNLTVAAAYREDWPLAGRLAARCLEFATEHAPQEAGTALMNLADIALHTGRTDLAEDFGRQALAAFVEHGNALGAAGMRRSLGQMYLRAERLDEAEPLFTEALAVFEAGGFVHDVAATVDMLGLLAGARQDVPAARAHWRRAADLFDRCGEPVSAADVRGRHGVLEYIAGDHAAGEELLTRSAAAQTAHGLPVRRAQVDVMHALAIEQRLVALAAPDPDLLARAVDLAVPAALAIDAVRYTLANGNQREQWRRNVAEHAMELAFRLAVHSGNARLLAELVESRCAGTPLRHGQSEDAGPPGMFALFEPPPPAAAPGETTHLGAALATAAAGPGLAVAPPPRLAPGPAGGIVLETHLARAEERYGGPIRQPGVIPTW